MKFFSLELKNQGGRRFIPALKDRVFAPSNEINSTTTLGTPNTAVINHGYGPAIMSPATIAVGSDTYFFATGTLRIKTSILTQGSILLPL